MVGFEGHLRPRVPQDAVSSQFVSPPRNTPCPSSVRVVRADAVDLASPPWLTPQDTANEVMSQLRSHYRASSHDAPAARLQVAKKVEKVLSPTSLSLPSSRGLYIVNKAQQTALGRLAAAEQELQALLSSEGINSGLPGEAGPEERIANAKAALQKLGLRKKQQAPPPASEEVQEVCMLDFVSGASQTSLVSDVFETPSAREGVLGTKAGTPDTVEDLPTTRAAFPKHSTATSVPLPPAPIVRQAPRPNPTPDPTPKPRPKQKTQRVQEQEQEQPQPPRPVPPLSNEIPPTAPLEGASMATNLSVPGTPNDFPLGPCPEVQMPGDFPSRPSTCTDISHRASLMSVTFLDGTLPQDKRSQDCCTLRLGFNDPNESMGVRWKYSEGCVVVDSLEQGGVCERAGLYKGCAVVSVNKVPVQTIQRLNKAVSDARCEQEWVDLGVLQTSSSVSSSVARPPTVDTATECTTEVVDASVATDLPVIREEDHKALMKQVETLQGAVTSTLEERDTLMSKTQELEAVREEFSLEQNKCAELQLLLDNCNEMLMSHESIAEQCKRSQAEQDQAVTTLEEGKRKLEHQLKMSKHGEQEAHDKHELIQRRLQLLEEDLELANERSNAQQQQVAKLEDDLSESHKAESDVTRRLNNTKTDLENAKDLVRQFQGNTELLVAENEDKRTALGAVKQDLLKVTRENTELKCQHDKVSFQSNEQGIELTQAREEVERQKLIISSLEAKLSNYEQRAVEDSKNVQSVVERNAILEADITRIRTAATTEINESVRHMEAEADARFAAMQGTHERELGYHQKELDEMKNINDTDGVMIQDLQNRVTVLQDEKQDLLSRIGALEMEQALVPSLGSPSATRGKRQSSRMQSPLSFRGSGTMDDFERKSRQSTVYFLDNVVPPDDGSCSAVWTPVKLNATAFPSLRFCTTGDVPRGSFAKSRTSSWSGGDLFMDRRISDKPVDGFFADSDTTQVTQTLTQARSDAEAEVDMVNTSIPPDAPSPSTQKVPPAQVQPPSTPQPQLSEIQETEVTLQEVLAICRDQKAQLSLSFSTLEALRDETVSTRELLSCPENAREVDDTVWAALAEIEELHGVLKASLDSYEVKFDADEAEADELVELAATV